MPFVKIWNWNLKHYISFTMRPRTTKIERVLTKGGATLPNTSRDLLTTWLHYKEKTLYLDFDITYDYQTWYSGNIGWGTLPTKSRDYMVA